MEYKSELGCSEINVKKLQGLSNQNARKRYDTVTVTATDRQTKITRTNLASTKEKREYWLLGNDQWQTSMTNTRVA